jgi:hypothetical protein
LKKFLVSLTVIKTFFKGFVFSALVFQDRYDKKMMHQNKVYFELSAHHSVLYSRIFMPISHQGGPPPFLCIKWGNNLYLFFSETPKVCLMMAFFITEHTFHLSNGIPFCRHHGEVTMVINQLII